MLQEGLYNTQYNYIHIFLLINENTETGLLFGHVIEYAYARKPLKNILLKHFHMENICNIHAKHIIYIHLSVDSTNPTKFFLIFSSNKTLDKFLGFQAKPFSFFSVYSNLKFAYLFIFFQDVAVCCCYVVQLLRIYVNRKRDLIILVE